MPTRMKVLTGNRGKRPLNPNEPEPAVVIPRKPRILQGVAAREWYKITKILHRLGLLTEVDKAALAVYCQFYQRWVDAEREVRREGMIVFTDKGFPVQSPYLSIANKAAERMTKMLTEFGMTPASRTRVQVVKPKQKKTGFDGI